MPSVDLQQHVDQLEDSVGIKSHLKEDDDIKSHLNEPSRPAPDVLPNGQPDAKQPESHGD